MEPCLSLESFEVEDNLCIICQKKKTIKGCTALTEATTDGRAKLKESAFLRKTLHDTFFAATVQRIDAKFALSLVETTKFIYHRDCYSEFTNRSRIERLKRKIEEEKQKISGNAGFSSSKRFRRGQVECDIEKCIFCQDSSNKGHLRQVTTESMGERIKSLESNNFCLSIRLSGVSDLKAAKVKYHSCCLLKSSLSKSREHDNNSNGGDKTAFTEICKELRVCSAKGQVLQLCDVWSRYLALTDAAEELPPPSFLSRRSTFKEKLEKNVGDVYQFFQPLDQEITERQMLLIPISLRYSHKTTKAENDSTVQPPVPNISSDFSSIVHTALTIRKELVNMNGHESLLISKQSANGIIPESLRLFLSVLLGGRNHMSNFSPDNESFGRCASADSGSDSDDWDSESEECSPECLPEHDDKTLSIAQDIVYAVSKGKKLTPKHIGLALALHQSTRSRKLVTLFHKAGHCLSYRQVLQVDSSLANLTLQSLDAETGAVTPPNFKCVDTNRAPLVHITADNIDILTDTLDGKNTFHGTQMVAFQRGESSTDDVLKNVIIKDRTVLQIPRVLNELAPVPNSKSRMEPVFKSNVDITWYESPLEPHNSQKISQATDMAFTFLRHSKEIKPSWSDFNKSVSCKNFGMTQVGYMPLILNPAHEWNTLTTVLKRCVAVADKVKQHHIILTVDQALYCKLLEIKWRSEVFQERVVLRMGGLHLAMNFLRTIGQHMANSGLSEVWLESGVLAEGSIVRVLDGKAYSKGMRIHTLSYQALWQILIDRFMTEDSLTTFDDVDDVMDFFQIDKNRSFVRDHILEECESNPNFAYWWSYLEMISVLLMLTRGIRDGDFDLYRCALSEILPYTARYDHTNYVKSLAVYIAEMHQLPADVEQSFRNGDFGVQRSKNKFSQVDADHAQEWVVGCSKSAGGLVGITQNENTMQRWALSFHWRGEITKKTYEMFDMGNSSPRRPNQASPSRQKRDNRDEKAILSSLMRFQVFSVQNTIDKIHNVATKDVGTDQIQASLLEAHQQGLKQVKEFVEDRLMQNPNTQKPKSSYHQPLKKNHPLTLGDLRKVVATKNANKIIQQGDRNVLQRLVMAYEAGREIDLSNMLKHELLPVPISLAEMTGKLRTGDKASLVAPLIKNISCPDKVTLDRKTSHLIIDGMAMINVLQKPAKAQTFGDFAEIVEGLIADYSLYYSRVDIIFDRYRPKSVKAGTREKRTKSAAPVRRVIENRDVPLPQNWRNFLALPDNKTDLCRFISDHLAALSFESTTVVIAAGFEDERKVVSTNAALNVFNLEASHEEADTRIILHAVNSSATDIVVSARDTDVFLLLVHHFKRMKCSKVWMMCGTSKNRKYIPIREVCSMLSLGEKRSILAWHALTGCDVTSFIATITKTAAQKVFAKHHALVGLWCLSTVKSL